MNKGLEALKELRNFMSGDLYCATQNHLDIIETELKKFDKQDEILRIIKEKQVDIHNLLESKTCEQYNNHTHWLGYKGNLTQSEYELVKPYLEVKEIDNAIDRYIESYAKVNKARFEGIKRAIRNKNKN